MISPHPLTRLSSLIVCDIPLPTRRGEIEGTLYKNIELAKASPLPLGEGTKGLSSGSKYALGEGRWCLCLNSTKTSGFTAA